VSLPLFSASCVHACTHTPSDPNPRRRPSRELVTIALMASGALDSTASMLSDLGIEEVEPMVCDDSFANRRVLRTAKLMWVQLSDEQGIPNGLIRAIDPATLTEIRDSVWERKKPLMQDPDNMYSEYLPPGEMPLDGDIPWWLQTRLRAWVGEGMKGVPEEDRREFPVRCEVIRLDGTRCWSWAGNPKKSKRCKSHAGWEGESEIRNAHLAKIKFLQASPAMADNLEALALTAAGEAVRLKATTEILDRAGIRGGTEIDMHVETEEIDSSAEVKGRLEKLAARIAAAEAAKELAAKAEEEITVEAEVVTDEHPS
jgi:hypothetical protein